MAPAMPMARAIFIAFARLSGRREPTQSQFPKPLRRKELRSVAVIWRAAHPL
jgi:hypothetical protein